MNSEASYPTRRDFFPYFEPDNFDGWLVQITAHLRGKDCHECLRKEGRPEAPIDEEGNPAPQTAPQRRELLELQKEWDRQDRIAYADVMMACRAHQETKTMTENGNFPTAMSLLKRLEEMFKSTEARQIDIAWKQFYSFGV